MIDGLNYVIRFVEDQSASLAVPKPATRTLV